MSETGQAAGATRGKRKPNYTHPEAENLINAVICTEGWREIPAKRRERTPQIIFST